MQIAPAPAGDTNIIDRTFPLSEARAAMRYLQDGGGPGRTVITPQEHP